MITKQIIIKRLKKHIFFHSPIHAIETNGHSFWQLSYLKTYTVLDIKHIFFHSPIHAIETNGHSFWQLSYLKTYTVLGLSFYKLYNLLFFFSQNDCFRIVTQ